MGYYSPDLGEVEEVESSIRKVFVVEDDLVGIDVVEVIVVPLVRIDVLSMISGVR